MISTLRGFSIPLEDEANAEIEQTISSINQAKRQVDDLDQQVSNI